MFMKMEIDEYLTYIKLEKKLSKNTILNYQFDLENYIDYLLINKISNFDDITLNDINCYLQELSKNGMNPRSIRRHITTIKEFHK